MLEDTKQENQQNYEELNKENRNLKRQLRNLESTLKRHQAMLAARTTINSMLESEQIKMERNMNLLLENSADIILLLDSEGLFTFFTDTFTQVTGNVNSGLISGRHYTEIFAQLVAQEWLDYIVMNYNLAMEQRSTVVINTSVDLSGSRGEPREYDVQITPMMDHNGQLEAVMMLFHDITDVMRAKRQAESASLAKSQFLATMSHEIRTPMNAILGIAEIQLQNETLDLAVKEALGKIYASGDMLLGIINDILDLSKIESGKLELFIDKYEIASLISDTAQLNMMRIGSKPIEFELYVDENAPTVLVGDELRVKQILNNILSNAFKYTAEGRVKLSITPENSNVDDHVILIVSISDTGQGMTREQVDSLFDEYSRFNMEANRTTEGTGLGMSITQNLIRLMNGEIFIDSEPKKGSTFTVHLPQGKIGSEVLGREMAENLQQFRASSRAQMKRVQLTREPMPYGSVLIVDDVETNIYVASGLLAPYGLKIDAADSGFAAIERIKQKREYDIVFMDHMMPVMDGIEATKIIRGMGYEGSIVALTANAVAGQADIFLGNGFDDFLSKPIDVRQLNIVLNKHIRDKQPLEVVETARRQAELLREQSSGSEKEPKAAIDPRFAEIFARDAYKSITALDALYAKNSYDEDDIRTFTIHVHGMKSALANIGEQELSALASKLEQAGRDNNTGLIFAEMPAFLSSLRALTEELAPKTDNGDDEAADEDRTYLLERLQVIKEACEAYDKKAAKDVITELRDKVWSGVTKAMLNETAEHLLHSDFDEVIGVIDKYLEMK